MNDIGVIWYNCEDEEVCEKCHYLAGRWFDAKDAYLIASQIHEGCRCKDCFDVGIPSEALVGPIPGYKPGTKQHIHQDLNIDRLVKDRELRGAVKISDNLLYIKSKKQ